MYTSYNSLRDVIQKDIENQKSVLNKFPEQISRPIAQSCSKHLAQFTSFQLPFKSDKQPVDSNNPLYTASQASATGNTSSSTNQSRKILLVRPLTRKFNHTQNLISHRLVSKMDQFISSKI